MSNIDQKESRMDVAHRRLSGMSTSRKILFAVSVTVGVISVLSSLILYAELYQMMRVLAFFGIVLFVPVAVLFLGDLFGKSQSEKIAERREREYHHKF